MNAVYITIYNIKSCTFILLACRARKHRVNLHETWDDKILF